MRFPRLLITYTAIAAPLMALTVFALDWVGVLGRSAAADSAIGGVTGIVFGVAAFLLALRNA